MSEHEGTSETTKLSPKADEVDGETIKPAVEKARNRMVAEGYKYKSINSDSDDSDSDTVKRKSKQWNKPNKVLLSIIIISIVVIAILASVVGYQYLKNKHEVCTSTNCVQVSAYITNKMDATSDPCKDFYQYACGNWEKTTHISATQAKYGVFQQIAEQITTKLKLIMENNSAQVKGKNSVAVQKMKEYYKMCLDIETINKLNIDPINEFILELGSWTISSPFSKPWNESSWNLMDALTAASRYGFAPFFSMTVFIDNKNSSLTIIKFHEAGLALKAHEQYFKNHSRYAVLRQAVIDFGVRLGELLGGNKTDAIQKMTEVYDFEQELANIYIPTEVLRDPVKSYHKMKIRDLQKMIGSAIDLKYYLSKTFNRTISMDEEMLTTAPEFFSKLGPLISKTKKSVLANYLVWHCINLIVGYLPDEFVSAGMILEKAEKGISKLDPRWMRCIHKAGSFGYAVGALYVEQYFKESSKADVGSIIEQIRTSLVNILPHLKWMDQKTRERALDKAKYVMKRIGYPDWILDVDKLDEHYADVNIIPGQFFKSHQSILVYNRQQVLNTLGKPADREKWDMTPTTVNAYYSPFRNQIVFPAAILQRPFYSPLFPVSFNYGSAGMIMGHELTHGFDSTGRHYNKYGNLENWWTNSSTAEFKKKAACIVKQYSKYIVEGLHIRGDRTLGENIADNGGLKLAHMAYKRWLNSDDHSPQKNYPGLDYTDEQLFFIGFAQIWCAHYTKSFAKESILTDVHTYAKYRVIGTLSNNEDFATAFSCKKNSPMNPEHKCQVW